MLPKTIFPKLSATFLWTIRVIVVISFEIAPGCAILSKQIQFPPSSSGSVVATSAFAPGGLHNQQTTGILTGPSPSWSPSEFTWNHYVNLACQSDMDCYPSRTILYCISSRCQCITQGATFLNGFFYNYNMEWSERSSQCISQSGSPCTLKQFRNAPGIVTMDCIVGHECVEVNSPAAKATIAAHTPTGYGSSVSVQQVSNQPHNYHESIQYFGSGVSSVSGTTTNSGGHNRQQIGGTGSSTTTASNTWGICVRRTDPPYHHEFNDSPNSSSGSGTDLLLSVAVCGFVFFVRMNAV